MMAVGIILIALVWNELIHLASGEWEDSLLVSVVQLYRRAIR